MPRKAIRVVKAAIQDDASVAAGRVLSIVTGALQRRFGAVPVGPRETVSWARVLLAEERAAVRAGALAKVESLGEQLRKFSGLRGFEGRNNKEAEMKNTITADGVPKPKRSKTVRLARAALRAGGLKKSMLTAEQWTELKAAVRADRATAKLAKQLGVPAAPTTAAAAAVDPVLAKVILPGTTDPTAAVTEVRKAFTRPQFGDGWRK